jgi:hypothetical protein
MGRSPASDYEVTIYENGGRHLFFRPDTFSFARIRISNAKSCRHEFRPADLFGAKTLTQNPPRLRIKHNAHLASHTTLVGIDHPHRPTSIIDKAIKDTTLRGAPFAIPSPPSLVGNLLCTGDRVNRRHRDLQL